MDEKYIERYEAAYKTFPVEPTTQKDVKKHLAILRERYGYLSAEDEVALKKSGESLYQKVRLNFKEQREDKAAETKNIATQLYDDPFRFFFEIIQNADDASYSKARKKSKLPCLTFRTKSTEIVIDSNEDGFTLADVAAICSTGKSSKARNAETTGEKGFGFKAVFSIASKVIVQSGLWSFILQHQRHEDGIGMVSPVWQEPTTLPDGVRTRFTLNFGNADASTVTSVLRQLGEQPVTILNSLRNIQKIRFKLVGLPFQPTSIVFKGVPTFDPTYERLEETRDAVKTVHHYRCFETEIADMPERFGRSQGTSSTVVVRFPVRDHESCDPLIDAAGQFVFAYLPIRQIPQIPFIIQADFLLPASRQDVSDNAWNRKLRMGVAKCFAQAACEFAREETHAVSHQWLQYLPKVQFAGFWSGFLGEIRTEIAKVKPFLSVSGLQFNASELRMLPKTFLHDNKPLFLNTSTQYHYLSPEYGTALEAQLQSLGVRQLSDREMVDQISVAISEGDAPLHRLHLTDSWHTSFTRLIKHLISAPQPNTNCALLRAIELLPKRDRFGDHVWVVPNEKTCYLPGLIEGHSAVGDVEIMIPPRLGIRVVHPDACRSPGSRVAYRLLGAKTANTSDVCDAIYKLHASGKVKEMSEALSHFEILFWCNEEYSLFLPRLYARNANHEVVRSDRLLFNPRNEGHMAKLVNLHKSQKYARYFLHETYEDSQVATAIRGSQTWNIWLENCVGVRWYPTLEDPDAPGKLHPLVVAVNEESPDGFLSLLQEHWSSSYRSASRNAKVRAALLNLNVLCQNNNFSRFSETWFPSSSILAAIREYGVEDEIPVLALPDADDGHELSSWPSLAALDIRATTSVDFYLLVLNVLSDSDAQLYRQLKKMTKLYATLGSITPFEKRSVLKGAFVFKKLIWSPVDSTWHYISRCVWSAQIPLQRKFVVSESYTDASVKDLFRSLLGIGDATIEDLVDEIRGLRESQDTVLPSLVSMTVTKIYSALADMASNPDAKKYLKATFEKEPLIYFDNDWLGIKECIWHESAEIAGRAPIQAKYPTLEQLFVTILGIPKMTPTFMLNELARMAEQPNKTWDSMKQMILDTGAVLGPNDGVDKKQLKLEKLGSAKFLPCNTPTDGQQYVSLDETFFILDDDRYTRAFTGRLPTLDFTYAETTALLNLLIILGINDRYLSQHVIHDTEATDQSKDEVLTKRLRDCAYAISCCAVFHFSQHYFNKDSSVHQALLGVNVCTSPSIRTTYLVQCDASQVKATADEAFVLVTFDTGRLQITVPRSGADQIKCLRAELPKHLADIVGIGDSVAISQIYRFINELDFGTDELLQQEGIPHTNTWLTKTERLPTSAVPTEISEVASLTRSEEEFDLNLGEGNISTTGESRSLPLHIRDDTPPPVYTTQADTANIRYTSSARPSSWTIPTHVNSEFQAPQYGLLLQHLYKQAAVLKNRKKSLTQAAFPTINEFIRPLTDLRVARGYSNDPLKYPQIFGDDELHNFRVGAAGELLVFGFLKSLLGAKFGLENWPSSIRHFSQAHPEFTQISHRRQREIADFTYAETGDRELMNGFKSLTNRSTIFHDIIPEFPLPPSPFAKSSVSEDAHTPLEWLIEVKTTLGPCETPFYMSESQYQKMSFPSLYEFGKRPRMYCIIRVYDLLKANVGIKIFIDPWRFKDKYFDFVGEKWRVTTKEDHTAPAPFGMPRYAGFLG